MKKIAFLIQMIEGYKVTFTWIYEKGFWATIKVPDGIKEDFLKKYDPLLPEDYPKEHQVTATQIKEEILEREKIDSEIRELFKLTKDCPIFVFNDGDHCELVTREMKEKLKNE